MLNIMLNSLSSNSNSNHIFYLMYMLLRDKVFGLISQIPGLHYGFFCFSFFPSFQLSLFPSVSVFQS